MRGAPASRGAPGRVTFVCDSDAWGGAEVYLTHHLRRAEESGWTASLVVAEPVAAGFAGLVPAERTAVVPPARHTPEAPAVHDAVRAQRPDVVAVNLVDPASNAAAIDAALAVAPTVGTLHLEGDTRSGAERAALAASYRRLAAVLAPSSVIAAQVRADLGVPADRVRVVHNGVDLPADPAGPAGHPAPRLGALGRLVAQKGFDVLLAALRLLVDDGVAVELVIGGAGRDEAALRAAAEGLPVTFAGFVDDVRGFRRGLDVFCLSSRRDALPLALLEAMAEGLPCAATDVGDVRAVTGQEVAVVPPEDAGALAAALRPLLTDPARRSAAGAAARRRAETSLDAALMARRTFAVLAEVAGAARTAR